MAKKDKTLFIGLIFFSIFVLFFSYVKIKEAIQGPFRLPSREIFLIEEEVQKLLAKRDTDEDGLFDADEVFRYQTSIYLTDSDSDGYNDKEEVEAGSDPINSESTPLRKIAEKKETEIKIPEVPSGEPSPAEIKDLLIKAGLSQETVEKVDDETLKKLYNETIKETGINPQELAPGGLRSLDISSILKGRSSTEISEFEKLSPQEIRQIMLMAGADPQILSQIDDQALKTLFLQAIKERQTQ